MEAISKEAFKYCDVEEIAIPSSIQTIGGWAFQNCESIHSLTIGGLSAEAPDHYVQLSIDSAFYSMGSLQKLVLGRNMTSASCPTKTAR